MGSSCQRDTQHNAKLARKGTMRYGVLPATKANAPSIK